MEKMIYKHFSSFLTCVFNQRRYENQDNLALMQYFIINLLKFIKFQTIGNTLKKKNQVGSQGQDKSWDVIAPC